MRASTARFRPAPSDRDRLPRPRRFDHVVACLIAIAVLPAAAAAETREGGLFRVETEVFADDDKVPSARSLTLFRDGVAWDFLQTLPKKPDEGEATPDEPTEFVLHDPARERIILVDPARHVRTQVDHLQLERLRASLGAWARKADDPSLAWAGGPEFAEGLEETSSTILLKGPRVRYEVTFEPAENVDIAEEYRRFADAAVLVKALVHPGGLPPFPRIAINRRVAAAGGIPVAVRLELESRMSKLGRRPTVMRSEHKVLASWLSSDHKRLAAAEERMSLAAPVDLATYARLDDATEGAPIAVGAGTDNRR